MNQMDRIKSTFTGGCFPVLFDGIVYDVLVKNDVEEAAKICARAFVNEALNRARRISEEVMAPLARAVALNAAEQGTGLVAREEGTNVLVGCLLGEDLLGGVEYKSETPQENEKFAPILALLDQAREEFLRTQNPSKGEVWHRSLTGVAPGYSCRSIGKCLYVAGDALAAKKGFRKACSDTTGPISQHITTQLLGYEPVHHVPYSSFEFRGEKPFHSIAFETPFVEPGLLFVVKDLDS